MDKYDLTQEQWDAMVVAQLTETQEKLDAGLLELISNEDGHAEIMRYIDDIAEKEQTKAKLSYQLRPCASFSKNANP